ncbi:MAG: hypothetical protein RL172_1795 [Bacteroidota bacterium]|jgi:D-threonine aldolase
MQWYTVNNISSIDTPALLLYQQRVQQNIQAAVAMVQQPGRLRPHVKTNKIPQVCQLMMQQGILHFKCATIAEAEMLAMVAAPDVLLAYQPVGPKVNRLLQLVQQYPHTKFSAVTDSLVAAQIISQVFDAAGHQLALYIDVDTGMHRTGIAPAAAATLATQLQQLPAIVLAGLHVYDGHITETDVSTRQQQSDEGFFAITQLANTIESITGRPCAVVAGGSPTFNTHINRTVQCSPGTFVFWDWGYQQKYPDLPFEWAALVACRVISIPTAHTITTDLGHKSVAAENPLPRVHFLNAPGAVPIGQSEEHLVLQVASSSHYQPGDVLYAVPVHICPTVALYEKAVVIQNNTAFTSWRVTARDKAIHI